MLLSFSILLLLCSYGTREEMLQACKCECQNPIFLAYYQLAFFLSVVELMW